MATFKTRIIRKEEEVVVKTISVFSAEELEGIKRIADDPNVSLDTLRHDNPEVRLAFLRLLHYWAWIWDNKETQAEVIKSSVARKRSRPTRKRK